MRTVHTSPITLKEINPLMPVYSREKKRVIKVFESEEKPDLALNYKEFGVKVTDTVYFKIAGFLPRALQMSRLCLFV